LARLALLFLILSSMAVSADFGPLRDAWRSGDVAAVERGLRPLAESGDARAQLLLGHLYQSGRGGAVDYPAALHWFGRAADQGVAEAQYAIGLMYELGYGTEVDAAEAEYWYGRAIAHGLCPGELDIDAYWNDPVPPPSIVD
jgi:TPR repeat protein